VRNRALGQDDTEYAAPLLIQFSNSQARKYAFASSRRDAPELCDHLAL